MALPLRVVEGTPRHKVYKYGFWAVWILIILLFAFAYSDVGQIVLHDNQYKVSLINLDLAIAFMVAILGLQVVVGFTGQIALGQSFFFGSGAYLAAWLVEDHHWSYLSTLLVIIPVCFLMGVIVGIPALRIRGLYLALVTLGLAAVFPSIVQLESLFEYTNGAGGKTVSSKLKAPDWLPVDGFASGLQKVPLLGQYFGDGDLSDKEGDRIWRYMLLTIMALLCFWIVGNLVKSRPGRAIRAIRDNETGASVAGVHLALYKTLSFGVSSALGGVGGLIYVMEVGIASPGDFTAQLGILFIVGLVVGGVGTLSGAVVGGLVISLVPTWASATQDVPGVPQRWLQGPTGTLILGVMLITLTFFLPGGIVAGGRRTKARFVVVVPRLLATLQPAQRAIAEAELEEAPPPLLGREHAPLEPEPADAAELETSGSVAGSDGASNES